MILEETTVYSTLLKNAVSQLKPSMEKFEADTVRGIHVFTAVDLATGNYITNGMMVIITGTARMGEPYFACVLGDRVCSNGHIFTMKYSSKN